MMTASSNDVRFANDVCLAAHWVNIASLQHEVVQHHFERSEKHHIAEGDASFDISKDFILKFEIALIEAGKPGNWLELLYRTKYIDEQPFKALSSKCTSLRMILISSCNTAKEYAK